MRYERSGKGTTYNTETAVSRSAKAGSSGLVCVRCGAIGRTGTVTPGSFVMELVLWLCFIVPGLLYSVWRLAARKRACLVCGSPDVIPVDSPRGREIVAQSRAG